MPEIKRPKLEQYQGLTDTPKYVNHNYKDDLLAILACQIKIWQPEGHNWFDIPKVTDTERCLVIREVNSIEINNSYKDPLSKAVLKFPRGTVIEKRKNAGKVKGDEIEIGDKDEQTQSKSTVKKATSEGDVITPNTGTYKDGVSTLSAAVTYDDKGIIDFNRKSDKETLLNPNDVAIGNRIEIRLGYAYSEYEFKKMSEGEGVDNNLELVFTGFITSVSVSTPLKIECENMAHILSTFNVPYNLDSKKIVSISEFMECEKKKDLLDGTGIELSKATKDCKIKVINRVLSEAQTIFDVFKAWQKSGIVAYMEDDNTTGKSTLKVGYAYYTGVNQGNVNGFPINDKDYITYTEDRSLVIIQFDWDVADDKLSLIHTDKKYLAVEATGQNVDGDYYKLVVRKHPDADGDGWVVGNDGVTDPDGQFQVSNVRTYKRKQKRKGGSSKKMSKNGNIKNRVSLKKYNVVEYHSAKVPITQTELEKEAKAYWNSYVPNGISGSLTIFGDLTIKPGQIVGLVDKRQPEKNGYYLVEAVDISFGANGYHKELKLPHKIASFKNPVTEIVDVT